MVWSRCRSDGGVAFLIRPSRRFETLPVYPSFLRRRHSINWSNCPRWSTLCATRPFAALLKLFSVLKSHFRSKARYYRGYQRHNRPPLIYCIRWYFMPLPQYSESHWPLKPASHGPTVSADNVGLATVNVSSCVAGFMGNLAYRISIFLLFWKRCTKVLTL